MRIVLPRDCQEIVAIQCGVVSRKQAIEFGLSADSIDWLIRAGRWRSLQRGVYAVFTGDPPRAATLWAAVHRAGPGAVLSHQTAAELFNMTDAQSSLIHVTVPVDRHVAAIPGLVIHRSARLAQARHPSLLPPRTRIEETVLDLAQQAMTFDAAFDPACAACQRRLTTVDRLVRAMGRRKKMRWRAELTEALAEIGAGAHSMLEYRYVHRVERPHGLPRAVRQARLSGDGRTRFLDNLYDGYGLCVELDGKQAHPDHTRWQDIRRANAVIAMGVATLRYGWTDVNGKPCQTAAQIAAVLASRGWPGPLRRCGAGCRAPLVP
jgi:predicted transcriptional regulator of viral defense system